MSFQGDADKISIERMLAMALTVFMLGNALP
jgi:hypothetical protein